MLLLFAAAAAAATLTAAFPAGTPTVRSDVVLEVLVTEGGRALSGQRPDVTPTHGEIVAALGERSPGRWRFVYRAPSGADRLSLQLGSDTAEVAVSPAAVPEPGLTLSGELLSSASSRRPITLSASGSGERSAGDLYVVSSEGLPAVITGEDGALGVQWQSSGTAFPRAVPLGVIDRTRPGPPSFVTILLQAGLSLPIQTEPLATVTVQIGRRSYGPFQADQDGLVALSVDVRPGETVASVTARDRLGNEQRSTVSLGGSVLPVLIGAVEGSIHPELPDPVAHFFAVRPSGRPWRRGEELSCVDRDGVPLRAIFDGEGRWRVPLPTSSATQPSPQSIECLLAGQARAQVEVPLGALPPSRVALRIEPPRLNADAPTATVRAYAEDARGDRSSGDELVLEAEHGVLSVASSGDGLQASYDGEEAVPHRGDTVTVRWVRPVSRAHVWEVELSAMMSGETVRLSGRALDQLGRAIVGLPLTLRLGNVEVRLQTDAVGWASTVLPMPPEAPVRAEVRAGGRSRQALLLPGQSQGQDPSRPELSASERIAVVAGAVRGIFVTTEPRIIAANSGVARVEVRPVDRSGNPVLDEELLLEASAGQLSMIEPEPDGSYYATYTPPPGVDAATVEITASTADGGYAATTDLTILPRVFKQLLSVSAGSMWSSRASSFSGWGSARYARQLPWGLTSGASVYSSWWHVELGGYRLSIDEEVSQGFSTEPAALELQTLISTSGLGGSVRRQQRRLAAWAGLTIAPNVYWTQARLGGDEVIRGWSARLAPLAGVQMFIGGGWQLGGGEWQLQLHGYSKNQSTSTIGWEAQVGGVASTVGYNFLF